MKVSQFNHLYLLCLPIAFQKRMTSSRLQQTLHDVMAAPRDDRCSLKPSSYLIQTLVSEKPREASRRGGVHLGHADVSVWRGGGGMCQGEGRGGVADIPGTRHNSGDPCHLSTGVRHVVDGARTRGGAAHNGPQPELARHG